ncbi:MAG: leucine-rich repeat domain-containing protein [Clostridia bacterium]|nr:leucine-rich repeat domain-containing protein [Clostridia bacterium]
MAYNDDSGEGNNFNIYYGLTAGQKVYIVLDFYDSDASGSFTLTVEAPAEPTPTPAATPIPVLAVGVNSVYVPADQMVRMSFVAPFSGEYAFYTTGDQDTEGYLYDADMNLLASDDDGGDLYNFSISYNLNAGQKVYASVCFYLLSESGTVSLVVEAPTPGPDTVIASGYYYDGNAGKTDITWTIKGDGSLTLSGNGEVEYEGELKGLDDYRSMVTSVEAGTGITVAAGFDHMVNLQTVNLPNVIMIDMRAFQGCTSLESVNAPNAKRISEEAFEDCTGLSNLNIDKIEEIGEEAFKNCISLTNMYLLDTISIYREAFSGCNLSLLQISASLETIGAYNFDTHSNLLTIYGGTPEQWASVTVHEGNSKLEHDFFFLGPKFILPAGLKEISEEAFANASMTFVVCPNEMERIGSRAFMNNRQPLAIEIPATVFEIADDAFEGCEDLMIVTGFDTYACRWAKDRGIWVVGY